ncbi:MAG TPA: hypothetical protein VGL23_11320 [Chloroflexota bacterium]
MDLRGVAAVAAAVIVMTACQAAVAVWTESMGPARPEPASAARFVAAYGAADETAAERVASPLYAAEWARRGLSTDDRAAARARGAAPDARPRSLTFQYVNGMAEPDGLTHLFYLAWPTEPRASPTLWRVDADTSGQVIWAEMVWLFSDAVTDVAAVTDPRALGSLPLPGEVARLRPRLALGLSVTGTQEGYYGLEVDAPGPEGRRSAMLFIAVDEDGQARPGAWSYGRAESALPGYDPRG